MKKLNVRQLLLLAILSLLAPIAFAWDHSIELGYGFSHDPNNTRYNNQGVLLSGDIIPLARQPSYFLSIGGALSQLWTNAPTHKHLTAVAIPLSLRYYVTEIYCNPAYIFGSAGPAYASARQFGLNKQGSNLTGQWDLGFGTELNNIDVNLRLHHFSNAHITSPDQGYSVLYLLSIGYLF